MTDSARESAPLQTPEALQTAPGILNLLGGDAAGFCSDGVCHLPGPDTKAAPKPE